MDQQYIQQFAARIRELYPLCPNNREKEIAAHACLKYSGRIGRCSFAKQFSEQAVDLAVKAHIRHIETDYDRFIGQGIDRFEARSMVENKVIEITSSWKAPT